MSLDLDKSAWETVSFGEVVRASKATVDPTDGTVDRYVAGEHMDTDNLEIHRWGDVGDGYLGPAFHRRFVAGQILYGSRRTYLRKIAVAEFDGVTANTTFVLETNDPTRLLQDFLPWVMSAESFHAFAIQESKGSVNPYINFSDLARYEFSLPPLPEQRRLADLLWSTEHHRRSLAHAVEDLKLASDVWLSVQLRSLPTRPLQDLAALRHGKSVPSTSYGQGDLVLLRPGDISPNGSTEWSPSTVRIPAEIGAASPAQMLAPGDIIINMTAQTLDDRFLGRVARVHDQSFLNQRIGKLTPLEGVDDRALLLALRSRTFTDWVAQRSEGSKVKHMHWRHIAEFPTPAPTARQTAWLMDTQNRCSVATQATEGELDAVSAVRRRIVQEVFG